MYLENPETLPFNSPIKAAFTTIMHHGDCHSQNTVMITLFTSDCTADELFKITGMTRPKSYNHAKHISGYTKKRTQHSILRLLTLLKASVIEDASWLGQVTELDLQGGHLSVLPPEILRLPKLQHLNLSNNQLTRLPANLGTALPQTSVDLRWNPLESLSANLSSIRLNREQWTQFADQIIAEGTVHTLDIRNNRLGCFPSALLLLTSLTALNIAGNNLTELPDLSPLSNLRALNLSNNELTQPDLTGLTSLNQLDIRDNPLNGIPVGINTLSALNEVHVNQIEADPSDILGCHGITRGLLQVTVSNDVTTRIVEHLSTLSLTSAPDLCSLLGIECPDTYTAWTKLEAPTIIKALILDLLSTEQDSWLQNITQFSMVDFGLTKLPEWLQRCTQLKSLSLAYNDLTTLPSWLHELNQLTALSVLGNPRFTPDRTLIPEQLVNLNLVGTAVSSQSGEWNMHSVKLGGNTFPSTHRNHPIRKATQQSLWVQTPSKLPLHENAILPTIESVEQLFRTLHAEIPMLTKGQLTWFCNLNTDSQPIPYVIYSIPKKSGGERQISVPHPILKQIQYWILKNILYAVPVHVAAHGFVPNRSIFTNAKVHMSPRLLLNMDLKDFFPSIGFLRVLRIFSQLGYAEPVANILAFLCTTSQNGSDRYLPQGAPTSPALSNLATWTLDQRLSHFCQQHQLRYTRYADDISISDSMDAKRRHSFGWVQNTARKIIESAGFTLHPTKTRILSSGHRQEVTGLVVNHCEHHSNPRVSREYRSNLYQKIQAGDVNGSINGKIAFVRQAQPDKADYLDSIKK